MCCNSSAPDTSGMNAAAVQAQQISAETLAWYKQKDAEDKPMRDVLQQKALEVADQQLASSKTQDALAKDYDQYNKTTFRPLEQGIVAEAEGYDTPAKRQAAVDSAMADTNMAFGRVNDASARTMAANGINPGSARALAVQQGQGVDQAVANAGAAYKARKGIETVGHGMKMDAASLGRGLASNQATSAQLALTAGNSAVGNAGVPLTASQGAASQVGKGYSAALNGQQVAGNLYGQAAQLQKSSGADAAWGALGSVAGGFLASDKNLKTDIEPADPEQALDEVTKTPVSKWRYDPAKLAAEGIAVPPADQGQNTGPMAQHVNATMGEEAAPGGKEINLISMNGKSMLAIQALDKKINKLSHLIKAGTLRAGERK